MSLDDLEVRGLPIGHLPVVRAAVDELGMKKVLDAHLPKHPLAQVSDGECAIAMVLNILSGRVALWRMDELLGRLDVELVLGEGIEAAWFHDTRLGQALDRIDEVGTDSLLSEVVGEYLKRGAPSEFSVHLDTTSLSVFGVYDTTSTPTPTYGFSKDKRPDLKQLVFGLSVHGSAGIPLTMSVCSGNTSDQAANRDHLGRLATLLPDPDEVTIVADCKLVDATTLGQIARSGFHFVSLVPESYKLRAALIEQAWEKVSNPDDWPILAERPGAKQADPPRRYRGMSFDAPFVMDLGQGDDAAPVPEVLRGLVVRSDALAERFERDLERKMARERDILTKTHKQVLAKAFACEPDARKAMEPLVEKLRLQTAEVHVDLEERVQKREKRGRPGKGDPPPPVERVWVPRVELKPDDAAIEQARRHASCFVLLTDWATDEWDDQRVLAEYRYQALIEGHTGFRWLKGPAAVAPVLLNTPHRIRALGFVFILALMVRNYIQFTIRAAMKDRGKGVTHPFRKKEDDNLTTEMALVWFEPILSTFVRLPGTDWRRTKANLKDEALDILRMLGFSPEIYARPPPR